MRHLMDQGMFPKAGFSINLPIPVIADLLLQFYKHQVETRLRSFIPTPELNSQILQIAQILGTPSHRFAIILMGTYGNGKTTMMYAIRSLIHFVYLKCHDAMAHLKPFNTSIPIISAKNMVKEIMDGTHTYRLEDMIMIDDWGSEPAEIVHYGMKYTPIIDLIEARYARMQYTILSTNMTFKDIRPRYTHRCADRLEEMAHVVQFNGDTFRCL